MMEFIYHDVVKRVSCEASQMFLSADGLNRREQDFGVYIFAYAVQPTKVCFWPNTAEGGHGLRQNFFAMRHK